MYFKSFLLITLSCLVVSIQAGGKMSRMSKTKTHTINYKQAQPETNFAVVVIALPTPSPSAGPEESASAHPFGYSDEASSDMTARLVEQLRMKLENVKNQIKLEQENKKAL